MVAVNAKRIRASSLVEVTVAAVILVVIFSLALAICARLALSGPNRHKLQAQQLVHREAMETIRTKVWHARTRAVGPIDLEQQVSAYRNNRELLNLRIEARQNGHLLASYQELIYVSAKDAR